MGQRGSSIATTDWTSPRSQGGQNTSQHDSMCTPRTKMVRWLEMIGGLPARIVTDCPSPTSSRLEVEKVGKNIDQDLHQAANEGANWLSWESGLVSNACS